MRFKKALMIPIFHYTEEEFALLKLEIDTENAGFNQTTPLPFWSIDNADIEIETGQTVLYCGGEAYITPLTLKELIKLVDNHEKTH